MLALARYLRNGVLDSRRWMPDGRVQNIVIPEDRDLGAIPPTKVVIDLEFAGHTPFRIQRDLVVYQNQNLAGSYLFPFAAASVAPNERFDVGASHLSYHHRHDTGNRSAYDLKHVRWEGAWTPLLPGTTGTRNEDDLSWERQVRAIASGTVLDCRRSRPDNSAPGKFDGGDPNFLRIRHASNPAADLGRFEVVAYVHFRRNSIPPALRPLTCPEPEKEPDCDIDADGIVADILGAVGNSGTSSNPHLHIHLGTEAPSNDGDPRPGSYPLLFRATLTGSPVDENGDPIETQVWHEVNGRALVSGALAWPTD